MAETKIENLVATAKLAPSVDCAQLAGRLHEVQYVPDRFDGLIMKRERATVLLFPDGRATVTGPKSEARAAEVLDGVRGELGAHGVETAPNLEIRLENVVLCHDLGTSLRLHQVALALDDDEAAFDPEAFPGIVMRPQRTQATVLVFASGTVVVTECHDIAEGIEAISRLTRHLAETGLLAR